jgi:hypothetical protein
MRRFGAAILFALCGRVGAFVPHAGTIRASSLTSLTKLMSINDDVNGALKQAMKDKVSTWMLLILISTCADRFFLGVVRVIR